MPRQKSWCTKRKFCGNKFTKGPSSLRSDVEPRPSSSSSLPDETVDKPSPKPSASKRELSATLEQFEQYRYSTSNILLLLIFYPQMCLSLQSVKSVIPNCELMRISVVGTGYLVN